MLNGRLHSFASEKSFSAFAIVQDEEFQQSGSRGGVKRCEEIMGPFTLFRMTWGLPKPVMGMSLSSCPERLPSLSFSHISTPTSRSLVITDRSSDSLANLWRV